MPGVDGERCQDRKHAITKEPMQVFSVVAVEIAPRHHVDVGITKGGYQLIAEEGGVSFGQVGRRGMDV